MDVLTCTPIPSSPGPRSCTVGRSMAEPSLPRITRVLLLLRLLRAEKAVHIGVSGWSGLTPSHSHATCCRIGARVSVLHGGNFGGASFLPLYRSITIVPTNADRFTILSGRFHVSGSNVVSSNQITATTILTCAGNVALHGGIVSGKILACFP